MTPTRTAAATAGVADSRKQRALSRLKARYGEARTLVSSAEPYANLDWVLGATGNPEELKAGLDRKMIPLLALWLQDLAAELERALSPGPLGQPDDRASPAHQTRQSVAASLREATEGFVAALRRSA